MDPQEQFCHNPACPDRGQRGRSNICIHSRKEQRYRCSTCGRTFAATTGTPFYRQRTVTEVVTVVLTLLCPGCLLQAIGAAFGFDERTVRAWQARVRASTAKRSMSILCTRARWISVMCRPLYRRSAHDVC
jgi:transposase-like protein